MFGGMHIEIESFLPHGRKKTEMPLLAEVFLRDLQFDGFICFLEAAEERGGGFAHLEINRPVFDLDDYIVVKFAVKRMKDVVSRASAIVFEITPVEMMVIDKGPVKNDAVMRGQCARNYVSSVGGSAAISGWPEPPLGIGFDDEAGKIRNLAVNLVHFSCPPSGDARVRGIKRVQPADHLWAADIDGNGELDSPGTKDAGDTSELR